MYRDMFIYVLRRSIDQGGLYTCIHCQSKSDLNSIEKARDYIQNIDFDLSNLGLGFET